MRPEEIARLLPEVYQAAAHPGSVLDAALGVMSVLHGSLEQAIAEPDAYADPRRAPPALTPVLASWLGLQRYLDRRTDRLDGGRGRTAPDPGDLRELTAIAADLARRRGTAEALRRFLEAATGATGFSVSDDTGQPFHIRVTVPPAAQGRRDLVERIVQGEKPAFSTAEIVDAQSPTEATPDQQDRG
jgi:phage tail-like protein